MKKLKAFILILAAVAVFAFPMIGCKSGNAVLGVGEGVKITFMLEGGRFQNSEAPIVYRYGFKPGTTNLIHDPAAEDRNARLSKSEITRAEYTFDGWYRTRSEDGEGNVTYEGRWDFENDRVTDAGVTLYAKWNRLLRYTYQLYYVDEVTGELVKIGVAYNVEEGAKFKDISHYAESRAGYTPIGFFDEEGNAWDEDFVHPGGDTSTEIKVIVKYTKGEYIDVATAAELRNSYNKDIRLVADIDFGGAEFSGFADYKHLFDGQGHTIRNFKLTYSSVTDSLDYDEDLDDDGRLILNISLFGKAENAEVKNVKFENVTIDIDTNNSQIGKIIVAPICVKATDSKFENVSVSATYTMTRLPNGFLPVNKRKEIVIVANDEQFKGCYFNDRSTLEQITLAIDNQVVLE
ncbi:MAG: hypothetical protein J1G04_00760 [Clostridiales bacterium]|nr:hypothetical protein [Clostridiales bacterium]